MEDSGIIKLVSKQGDAFDVPVAAAKMSSLVNEMLSDVEDEEDIPEVPLPNVESDILKKVIDFCVHYQEEQMTTIQTPLKAAKVEDIVQPWYSDFVKVPKNTLFDLVAAANYMDIKPLLDISCLAVSVLIKGKSAAELREMFNISADFSPEEEAQMQQDNQFAQQNEN